MPRRVRRGRYQPGESWRALWSAGFLGAAIPRPYGGLGLDMPTYAAVIGTIARG